jgi:hypothetical protein
MPEINPAPRLTPRSFFACEERVRRARERNAPFCDAPSGEDGESPEDKYTSE